MPRFRTLHLGSYAMFWRWNPSATLRRVFISDYVSVAPPYDTMRLLALPPGPTPRATVRRLLFPTVPLGKTSVSWSAFVARPFIGRVKLYTERECLSHLSYRLPPKRRFLSVLAPNRTGQGALIYPDQGHLPFRTPVALRVVCVFRLTICVNVAWD